MIALAGIESINSPWVGLGQSVYTHGQCKLIDENGQRWNMKCLTTCLPLCPFVWREGRFVCRPRPGKRLECMSPGQNGCHGLLSSLHNVIEDWIVRCTLVQGNWQKSWYTFAVVLDPNTKPITLFPTKIKFHDTQYVSYSNQIILVKTCQYLLFNQNHMQGFFLYL